MATEDSMEAGKYYAEALTHRDRANSAYKSDELNAVCETRKSAFENLKHLEQAAQDQRPKNSTGPAPQTAKSALTPSFCLSPDPIFKSR